MKRPSIHLCVLLFTLLFFCREVLSAQDKSTPELKDIIVTTSSSHLLLFAEVAESFTPEMITGVQNGIPITFVFTVELNKSRNNWFDANLVAMDITHTMTYNSLKEEYIIERSNIQGKQFTTKSLDEAKRLMAELNGINIIELSVLVPDLPYSLKIKATLEKNTLPLGMHYVVPFTSLWDFETDWRIIDFRY